MDGSDSTKRCCTCRLFKPLDAFGRYDSAPDGRDKRCKDCCREARERRRDKKGAYNKAYWKANPDKIKAKEKRHYERHKERLLAAKKVYRENNAERIAEIKRRYYEENREYYKARFREYREANPEVFRRLRAKRRLLEGEPGGYTEADLEAMYRDQGGVCAYCEEPLSGAWEADHMVPLARGGADHWSNIAVVCPLCNRKKHATSLVTFMARLTSRNGS